MTVRTGHEADAEPASLVSFIDLNPETEDFLEAVLNGLSCDQKELPCKFFYDERGSRLFDQICDLEEYYPTRTEIGILQDRLGEIAELIGRGAHLVELGSGASVKIRTLLNALPDLAQYTCISIQSSPKVVIGRGISSIDLQRCSDRIDHHLPPCCCGSAEDLSPKINHLLLIIAKFRVSRVPNWLFSRQFYARITVFIFPLLDSRLPDPEVNCDTF